jgi:arylsulfatase A-like enzyme
VLRALAHGLRRILGTGPGAGALTLALLFPLDLTTASLDFMGFSDEKATRRILGQFGLHIVAHQLLILATYVAVGALLGTAGAWVGRAWDWSGRNPPTPRRQGLRGALAALGGHLLFVVHNLVHYPQLYSESLYDRGGWRKRLMVTLTDHVSLPALDTSVMLVLVAVLAVPVLRSRGRALADRLLAAAMDSMRQRRRWAVAGAGLLSLATLVLIGAHQPGRGPLHRDRPNVLLIAVDSLRADRVFGPDAARRRPAIAQLAASGVRFENAHVTVARTFPSFVTLLTGRWPHHHGIRHMFPTADQRNAIGPALPSALHKAGWRTAVVSDYAGEIFSRTPLGFSSIEVPRFDMRAIVEQRGLEVHPNVMPYANTGIGRWLFPSVDGLAEHSDPSVLADRAIAALDRLSPSPFFLTVFFSAAHFPYAAPAPYYKLHAQPGYDGPFRYQKPPLAPVSTPADAAQIRALYDGAVEATDAAIARLLAHLRKSGLADDTIVVLLADHGENLFEDPTRGMGHGDHLRGDAADHVPLVIADPIHKFAPHDVPGIVRDVDLAPTLAALAGVAPAPTDGTSLEPLLRGDKTTLDLDAYGETEFWFTDSGPGFEPDQRLPYPGITGSTDLAEDGDIFLQPVWQDTIVVAKHRDIRTARYKLVYQPTREGVRWHLFDLAADPDERKDLAPAHPPILDELRTRLFSWITSDGHTVLRGGFAVPR